MMRKRIAVSCLLLVSALWAGSAMAEGTIALFLGQKSFDDEEFAHNPKSPDPGGWAPVETMPEIGVHLSVGRSEWPVKMAVDFLYAYDSDTDEVEVEREGSTFELGLGVRKFWSVWGDRFQPFVGGGLTPIKLEQKATAGGFSRDDDQLAMGPWVDCGILWTVRKKFSLGLDLRWSMGKSQLRGTDVDAGGTHVGLLLGWEL